MAAITCLEDQPVFQMTMPPQYVSIDVECVATGIEHNRRAVAQIAMVDQLGNVVLNLIVKPSEPVVSYLTDLTGLTKEIVDGGYPLDEALRILHSYMNNQIVVVGQSVHVDIAWLKLIEGVHFHSIIDLKGLFQSYNDKFKSYTIFSLEHEIHSLLPGFETSCMHNAVTDAQASILLFNYYLSYQQDPAKVLQMRRTLLTTPRKPSFAQLNPTYEGVCMGNKRTCQCGAGFKF